MDTKRLFDEIAPTYDRLNRLLSLGLDSGWRRQAVRVLAPHRPRLILDVATGSGDLAVAALTLNPDAVTAVDISPGMLSRAAAKVARTSDGHRITLQSAAAEALPFADRTFDAVCVGFGVRNFADLDKGLGEIFRVLKSGGIAVILEFSRPRNPLLRRLHRFYLRGPLPWLGGLVSGNRAAYVRLAESVLAFPHGVEFTARLSRAGFSATACRRLSFGICSVYCGVR
jgi:demethylmenaquinone methyltransferase/2-methoxy-6-polyprenyl-1,4-benzoquinol methylase